MNGSNITNRILIMFAMSMVILLVFKSLVNGQSNSGTTTTSFVVFVDNNGTFISFTAFETTEPSPTYIVNDESSQVIVLVTESLSSKTSNSTCTQNTSYTQTSLTFLGCSDGASLYNVESTMFFITIFSVLSITSLLFTLI